MPIASQTPWNGKLSVTGVLDISKAKLKFTTADTLTQPVYVIAHYGTLAGTQFVGIEGLPSGATIDYHHNNGVDANNIAIHVPVTTSGYASWASTNGLTAANDGSGQDPDNDGIANLLEFVLGGNPLASSSGILPVQSLSATEFVFTFKRADDSEGEASATFEWSNTLAGWPNVVPIGATSSTAANGVVVTVDEAAGNPDTITVKVPRANAVDGKLFGRIKAVR